LKNQAKYDWVQEHRLNKTGNFSVDGEIVDRMDRKTFDFFDGHSPKYLEMAFKSDKCEIVENPDGYGRSSSDCGDTIELFVTVNKDRIRWVSFEVNGCINTRACANTVVQLAEGKTIADARKIKPDDIVQYLETLPAESVHCAEIAANALYSALKNYRKIKQDPWRKLYPK
jgi:nitrogen fixation protein NifU and related proteins